MSKSGAYYMDTLEEAAAKLAEVIKERDALKEEVRQANFRHGRSVAYGISIADKRDESLAALKLKTFTGPYTGRPSVEEIDQIARAAIANATNQKESATGNGVPAGA